MTSNRDYGLFLLLLSIPRLLFPSSSTHHPPLFSKPGHRAKASFPLLYTHTYSMDARCDAISLHYLAKLSMKIQRIFCSSLSLSLSLLLPLKLFPIYLSHSFSLSLSEQLVPFNFWWEEKIQVRKLYIIMKKFSPTKREGNNSNTSFSAAHYFLSSPKTFILPIHIATVWYCLVFVVYSTVYGIFP